MQIRRSRWQDLCLVVWSSCNRGISLATNCACRVARRLQTTSRPATTVSGNSFSVNYFFHFSFLRERTRFVCCGFLVDRHADQKKQVARLVPRGMIQLQPGYQPCNELRLSCCASIANDKSASNNSLGNSFSVHYFFLFSFSQRENTFCLLRIARRSTCGSEEAGDKTCASWYGPVATGVPVLQRFVLVVLRVDCKRQVAQQQQSRGILFKEIIFSFSLFSHRANAFRLVGIARRTTCR